jgi:hypothetical protein
VTGRFQHLKSGHDIPFLKRAVDRTGGTRPPLAPGTRNPVIRIGVLLHHPSRLYRRRVRVAAPEPHVQRLADGAAGP